MLEFRFECGEFKRFRLEMDAILKSHKKIRNSAFFEGCFENSQNLSSKNHRTLTFFHRKGIKSENIMEIYCIFKIYK